MAKKKFFLDETSKQARKKTIDELAKKHIQITDEDKIVGGFIESPLFIESPVWDEGNSKPTE